MKFAKEEFFLLWLCVKFLMSSIQTDIIIIYFLITWTQNDEDIQRKIEFFIDIDSSVSSAGIPRVELSSQLLFS